MAWDGYQKDESALWGKAITETFLEADQNRAAAVSAAAARGFASLPGDTMETLQAINVKVQARLTDANLKIYETEANRALQDDELTINLGLAMLKAELDLYKANQQKLYELDEAEAEQGIKLRRTDIDRLLSEIEQGQVALIQMKADLEHDLNVYKMRVVNAELLTLEAEQQLAQEKYLTALEKLKIIDELYKLIDAEQLALEAERIKMAALDKVITAERIVAEVKKAMVPLYLEKAAGKEYLAAAITEDAKVQRAILMLGYEKIAMKDAEQAADEALRQAELTWEGAHNEWVIANLATELARIQARIALLQHSTDIKYEVLGYDLEAAKKKVDLRVGKEVWNSGVEQNYNTDEREESVSATGIYAASHAAQLLARAQRRITRKSGSVEHLGIAKEG